MRTIYASVQYNTHILEVTRLAANLLPNNSNPQLLYFSDIHSIVTQRYPVERVCK